jgi:ribosome-binding factor A
MSRSDKVAEEIKREMGQILQQELRDPRLGFTTITRVDLAADLRFARIFFSVYGDEKQWKDTAEALTHATGFIRRTLGERLELRFVPEIVFTSDHSSEYSIIVEKQLQEIKSQEPKKRKKNAPKKAARRTAKKKK